MIIEERTRDKIKELRDDNKLTVYEAMNLFIQLEILSELKQIKKQNEPITQERQEEIIRITKEEFAKVRDEYLRKSELSK